MDRQVAKECQAAPFDSSDNEFRGHSLVFQRFAQPLDGTLSQAVKSMVAKKCQCYISGLVKDLRFC